MKALLLEVCGKALFLWCLSCILLPMTVNACSCVEGSLSIPRSEAIMDSYCRSSMVYAARVVGATCNCRTASQNNSFQLQCHDYQQQEGSTTGVEASLIAWGTCKGETFSYELGSCDDLSMSLSVDPGVPILNGSGLVHTVNLTDPTTNTCRNLCPFNNGSIQNFEVPYQLCNYAVDVLEIFKTPNNNTIVGSTLSVVGPDVLTSCGNSAWRLSINTDYLVGVGGACSPISDWSTLGGFSESELNMLRWLKARDQMGDSTCGSLGLLSSVPTFLLALLISLQCSYL